MNTETVWGKYHYDYWAWISSFFTPCQDLGLYLGCNGQFFLSPVPFFW